jgi:hypothetical protein
MIERMKYRHYVIVFIVAMILGGVLYELRAAEETARCNNRMDNMSQCAKCHKASKCGKHPEHDSDCKSYCNRNLCDCKSPCDITS